MPASYAKCVMRQCNIVSVINIYVTHGKKVHTKNHCKKAKQEATRQKERVGTVENKKRNLAMIMPPVTITITISNSIVSHNFPMVP